MKKGIRNILIVSAILLICIMCAVFSQFDNIKALIYSYQLSDEDIESKIEDNDKILQKYMDDYDKYIANAEDEASLPTPEAVDNSDKQNEVNLNDDSQGSNEKIQDETIKTDSAADPVVDPPDAKKEEEPKKNTKQKTEDEIIGEYVVLMYSLKNEFVYSLSQLEKKVYEEYNELSEENKDFEHKKQIIMKHFNYVANLEKQCDSKVEEIIINLKKELKKIDADTSIAADIKKVYENEKTLKKAYYINLLKKE